jgi:hypothetical protein
MTRPSDHVQPRVGNPRHINIAQNRYEARRGLVLQEANSVQAAWLRSKLIGGERGPPITAMI